MIDKIKIYGERNSGTRYIRQIITQNIVGGADLLDSSGIADAMLGWKHGYPMLRPDTLYIFMLRPVYEWLSSMYSTPYECWHVRDQSTDFEDFIQRPFFSSNRSQSRKYCGEFKNILHARNSKYKAYRAAEQWKYAIHFNIEAIKDDPALTQRAFQKFRDHFEFKHDGWAGVENNTADPSQNSRTRANRYQLTDEDREAVDFIIKTHRWEITEYWVNQLRADVKNENVTCPV